MKRNQYLGILWAAAAVILTLLLIRGISGGAPFGGFPDLLAAKAGGDAGNSVSITKEERFPAENIRSVSFSLQGQHPMEIKQSGDSDIHVEFWDGAETNCTVSPDGGTITVKEKSSMRQHKDRGRGKIRLLLPAAYNGGLRVDSTSGAIKADGIRAASAQLEVVSGSVTLEACTIPRLSIECVTGSIKAGGTFGKLDVQTVTGSIKAEIREVPEGKCSFETVTGSVTVSLPRSIGYTVDYDCTTGSFKDAITRSSGKKSGTSTNGSGDARISVSVVTGSITVQEL
ncbi:MAG: DUF4097 family beta strand repeat protein [Treponema sp.]|nr:DUF4097 family beta strand repeat protein [Treponema sp.]